jgi:hypothetical protein
MSDGVRDERDAELDRVLVAVAAKRLGISESAVRKRVERGQIPHEKDDNGRLWVYVARATRPEETGSETSSTQRRDEAMDILRDQVAFLRAELERKDALLLNMTEAMKALNPPREEPSESRQGPSEPSPEQSRVDASQGYPEQETGSEGQERRSWWRRVFLGE